MKFFSVINYMTNLRNNFLLYYIINYMIKNIYKNKIFTFFEEIPSPVKMVSKEPINR